YSTDYETIVMEEMKTLYVKQSMMSIVQESCIFIGLTTYEARKKVIAKMTAFLRKTPILFSDTKDICFFHTHGNHNLNNHWFSANHILDIHSSKNKNRSEEHTSELQSRFDLVCGLLLEKKDSR